MGGLRETPYLSITDSALREIPGMKRVASCKGDPPENPQASEAQDIMGSQLGRSLSNTEGHPAQGLQ